MDSATRSLLVVYDEMPPTENHIRQVRWGRVGGKSKPLGMTYTPEAENYRNKFKEFVRNNHFVEIQKFRRGHDSTKAYTLQILFFFPAKDILNKGWLKNGKSKAKTPYKKMDVGNRRKLLEDCFAAATDIDDSLYFGVELYKFVSDEPRVEILLEEEDPQTFGIPDEYSGRKE